MDPIERIVCLGAVQLKARRHSPRALTLRGHRSANKYFAFRFRHPEKINQPVEAGRDSDGFEFGDHAGDVMGSVELFPRHSPVRRAIGSSRRSCGSDPCGSPISAFRFHETHLRGYPIKLSHVIFPTKPNAANPDRQNKFNAAIGICLSCGPAERLTKYVEELKSGAVSPHWSRARNSPGRKSLYLSEAVDRRVRQYGKTDGRRLASRLRHLCPAQGRHPPRGSARKSKARNTRLRFSSASAVLRQSDEALAKSSANWINFSRHTGSLISRNALIKRTPSIGSTASGGRSLLTSSS